MSSKINNIIEELKSLTLLEAAELVKQIEEIFGVDASTVSNSSMMIMPTSTNNTSLDDVEEQTEFDVILEEVPAPKKISILKVVRSLTSLGLKEAKELVESTPKSIKENISKEDAEKIKLQLEGAGAKVSVK
uniref:Large ribosomal subunit protein bL12c n=1 Tax=Bostrychia simpliciuscula TaxID=324754 RepID=A0A1Z1M7V1_9FLOR|nr:ribosomal protein L12 [Bostrychia simpliciuscula]ARW62167.1 ribosomal protein L12 [Bostrychia simpliciuscula]